MSDILNRFSLDAAKFNSQILICLVLVWLVVLGTAVSSVMSRPFTKKQRVFWILLMLFVPVFGLLAYLPFSASVGKHEANFGFGGKK